MKLSTMSAVLLGGILLVSSGNAQTVIYDGSQDLNFFSGVRVTDDIAVPLIPNSGDGIWLRSTGRRMRNIDSATGTGLASTATGVDGVFFSANPTENNPDPMNPADRDPRGTGAAFFLNDAGATTGLQTLNFSLFYNDATPNAPDPAVNRENGGNVAVRVYGIQNSGVIGDEWATDDFTMVAGSGGSGALIAAAQYRDMDAGGAEPTVDQLLFEDSSDVDGPTLFPVADEWQSLSFQFDAGTGYDYLVFGFGGAEQDDTNLPADRFGFDNISFEAAPDVVDGDFNDDGAWDCMDIDALSAAVATGSGDLSFDMNGDGSITLADINAAGGWLEVGGANNPDDTGGNAFLEGDANLDGDVNGQDFVVWNSNKFTSNTNWCEGNFNGDMDVDGQDFVIWNSNKFMSSDGFTAVPEPGATTGIALWIVALLYTRRRN